MRFNVCTTFVTGDMGDTGDTGDAGDTGVINL